MSIRLSQPFPLFLFCLPCLSHAEFFTVSQLCWACFWVFIQSRSLCLICFCPISKVSRYLNASFITLDPCADVTSLGGLPLTIMLSLTLPPYLPSWLPLSPPDIIWCVICLSSPTWKCKSHRSRHFISCSTPNTQCAVWHIVGAQPIWVGWLFHQEDWIEDVST